MNIAKWKVATNPAKHEMHDPKMPVMRAPVQRAVGRQDWECVSDP